LEVNAIFKHLFTFSKNDVISSVQKRYCALGLGLDLWFGLTLGLVLGLRENHFLSNVFSSKN